MITKKTLITIGCTAVMAAVSLVSITACSGKDENNNSSSTASDVLEPMTEVPTEPPMPDPASYTPDKGLTGRAKVLLRENEDVVGYIKISNTVVDYPVIQYDGDNVEEYGNDYYLSRDIYGNYFFDGCIFMDYRDNFEADDKKQSENIVLYGHNLLNGMMFTDLHKYRKDESFYKENPIIEFSSNYEDYKYIIFAYAPVSGYAGDTAYGPDFQYWNMQDLSDKKEFNEYVETVKYRSMISPDIDVQPGDKLLTLSTCHLDEDESRLIVVARRLRDHETVDKIDKEQSTGDTEDKDKDEEEEEQEQNEE